MLHDEELCHWKTKWINVLPEDRSQTLSALMKQCSKHSLPNIFTLLKLFPTLPLSSCSCEGSVSTLRRLNYYLISSLTEVSLITLAQIHSNYETQIDVDTVCKLFLQKHPVG